MKLRALLCVFACFAAVSPAMGASRELTVFSDGLLVEIEATARRGVAEVQMPAAIREGSLRVKPLDGGMVGRVELLPFKVPDKQQKELDNLIEQKNRLEDRLKALDTREEIFAAAAKSQSSKAPRKTKTNPDPLASVRQGTDFAIAQLETVLTARRRTQQELKRLESRLELLRRAVAGGPSIRVMTPAPATRIKVAAVLTDGGWKPRYELRFDGGTDALLVMSAQMMQVPDGFTVRVSPMPLTAVSSLLPLPLAAGAQPRLAEWRLPVEKAQVVSAPFPSFQFSLKNSSGMPLPAGEAAIYGNGEYLGTVLLPETAPSASFMLKSR